MRDQGEQAVDVVMESFEAAKAELLASRAEIDSSYNILEQAIQKGRDQLLAKQASDGHWCYELEADCTISAEYILMMHFMDEVDADLQQKIARYIRSHQAEHGGWPLYAGGDMDISCSVKAYYALKLVGDQPDEPHMQKAREAILAQGGAARSNVFTRLTLTMFEQMPWRAVPFIPAEIMLLPRWFPFHIYKVSYWSRTVMIPLTILYSLKAKAKNPKQVGIAELFTVDPWKERRYFPIRSKLNKAVLLLERVARLFEPVVPGLLRNYAINKAVQWMLPRMNGEDGLGGIFPAMVNAYEALSLLGYAPDNEYRLNAKRAIDKLLVIGKEQAYCQPCLSPVWDTALSALTLHETNQALQSKYAGKALVKSLDWLVDRQIQNVPGDWLQSTNGPTGGGWAFQYRNDYYPDVDDTAAVAWALLEVDAKRYADTIDFAAEWLYSMQSSNGGFGAFDKDNTAYYLNEIPFADHGALLDPPSSDVSARCVAVFAHQHFAEHAEYNQTKERCLNYLLNEQEKNGAWFGRWGTNYLYGTWSVLSSLEKDAASFDTIAIKRAVKWLKATQNTDGGWGETNDSYADPSLAGRATHSNAFQTAWALLALLAAGESHADEVEKAVQYLLETQATDGNWYDKDFTAPGFPRVFYLKYHGYDKFFPLWALARYYNLRFAKD